MGRKLDDAGNPACSQKSSRQAGPVAGGEEGPDIPGTSSENRSRALLKVRRSHDASFDAIA